MFIVLYLISRNKYREFIEPLSKKQYPLKILFPVTLLILDLTRYKYGSVHDRRLLFCVAEIWGIKYSQYYLRIHYSNKILYTILAIILSLFLGQFAKIDAFYFILCIGFPILLFFIADKDLYKKIKERRMEIRMDFPDFLNKLILLINAGLTVSKAWEKIVVESKKSSVLYDELLTAILDIRTGKSEYRTFEDFAKRCRIPEVTRTISIILQNQRKGNSEIVSLLRVHANECWEMRRNAAKIIGEEASTKMLAPMMLMLFAILLIVGAPAIIMLRGF